MTGSTELKRLADRVLTGRRFCGDENHKALADGVLALIAENERLENDHGDMVLRNKVLRERPDLAADRISCHDQVIALQAERDLLKADNERLTGFVVKRRAEVEQYDQTLIKVSHQRDELRAEIAGLRTGYEAYERVNAELKAENEALRKNADRYQWLRLADWWRSPICVIRNPKEQAKLGSDCPTGERLDIAVDAAMSKGEQS